MRTQSLLVVSLFFACTFIVYGSSLSNEFVSWDDTSLIVDNPVVQSMNPGTLRQAFTTYDPELYIPFTFVSYQIDHLIGGQGSWMVHLTNLVLHTMNAILVAWLLFLFVGNGWLAIALGLLFALHPLNTEAVAWASARKDVLSTFFFFSSVLSYIYASDSHSRKLFLLSLTFFFFGLLSKVMVVTLPIVLVLLDVARGRSVSLKLLSEKIPFLLLAALFGIIGIFGKTKILIASTLWQKILMATKSIVFYVQKFLWPTGLSVVYPYTKVTEFSSIDFALPFILSLLILGGALILRKRNRLASCAILFFLLTLVPTFINFAKGGDIYFASDRYAYVPMVGLLLLIGVSWNAWLQSAHTVRSVRFRNTASIVAALFFLGSSAIVAHGQAAVWRDSMSLYEHAIGLYPNARAAQNNLGMEQMLAGNLEEAILSFKRSLAIQPDPRTKINLAAAYVGQNRFNDAEKAYHEVLEVDPNFAEAVYGIGNILQKRGKLPDAAAQYRRAIQIDPRYFNAYNNLGAVYLQMSDWKNAVEVLRKSIELNPSFTESSYNLALALIQLGEREQAERVLRHVLESTPDDPDALSNLAVLLYDRGDIDGAAKLLQESLAIDSTNSLSIGLVLRMKKDGYVR